MNFAAESPVNDASVLNYFAPILDSTINWCEIHKTPSYLVDKAAAHLKD